MDMLIELYSDMKSTQLGAPLALMTDIPALAPLLSNAPLALPAASPPRSSSPSWDRSIPVPPCVSVPPLPHPLPATEAPLLPTLNPVLPAPAGTASSASSDPVRIIVLANGTRIQFSLSAVPDPPLISFSNDILKLARMWDDADPLFVY